MLHPWRFGFTDVLEALKRVEEYAIVQVPLPGPAPMEAAGPLVTWVDLRGVKRDKRGRRKGTRPWTKISGITLHQMAVVVKTPERCKNMPVHGAVLDDGAGGAINVLLHDPTDYMWHANGFNRRDIGIEIACQACGIEGDPRTLWLPRKHKKLTGDARLAMAVEATDGQLEGARQMVQGYTELVEGNGGHVQFIHAHRQATKNRVSDPGSRIWKAVGIWAQAELGLAVGGPNFQISDGKALPDAWTGKPHQIPYNWRVAALVDRVSDA